MAADELDLVLTGLRLEPGAVHGPLDKPAPDITGKLLVNIWSLCAFGPGQLLVEHSKVLELQAGDCLILRPPAMGQPPGRSLPVSSCVRIPDLPDDFAGIALSGQLSLAGRTEHPLLAALPALTQAPRGILCQAHPNSCVSDLIEAAARSGTADTTLFGRLFEVLLIQVLRWKISAGSTTGPGFARALQDPGLGRAIAAMHHNPGYNWSLERLAAAGGLSRSAFSRRFTELTGTPAMKYLTSCRMHIALRQIRAGQGDIERVARFIGYRSPAAFQKAFKRVHGLTPAQAAGA